MAIAKIIVIRQHFNRRLHLLGDLEAAEKELRRVNSSSVFTDLEQQTMAKWTVTIEDSHSKLNSIDAQADVRIWAEILDTFGERGCRYRFTDAVRLVYQLATTRTVLGKHRTMFGVLHELRTLVCGGNLTEYPLSALYD